MQPCAEHKNIVLQHYGKYISSEYAGSVKDIYSLLVSLQAKDIDNNSRRGFEAIDQALKARAEQQGTSR